MKGLAILLIILSVASMAGHSVTRKWLFNKSAVTELELLVFQSGIASLLCGLWFMGFVAWDELVPFRESLPVFIIAIVGTTIANIGVQFANTRATRLTDLSYTSPISAMTPGFVVVTAAIFGELPSTIGYVGIALVVGGAYAHAREGARLVEYFQPLFVWGLFGQLSHLPEAERLRRLGLR